MGKVSNALIRFLESDIIRMLVETKRYSRKIHSWEIWLIIVLVSLPITFLLYFLLWSKITDIHEKHLRKKGIYYKELPIHEVDISFSRRKDKTVFLTCKSKKVRTRDANEVTKAIAENKKLRQELLFDIFSIIPKDEICMIARSGSIYKKNDNGEMQKSDGKERTFCIDASNSWEKKKNGDWLSRQSTLMNYSGHVVAIRGIDRETAMLGYDICIPDADERVLSASSLTELLKYCDAKNCILQIKENGSAFTYSDKAGYTKADLVRKIKEAAVHHGYKVKIKKKGR